MLSLYACFIFFPHTTIYSWGIPLGHMIYSAADWYIKRRGDTDSGYGQSSSKVSGTVHSVEDHALSIYGNCRSNCNCNRIVMIHHCKVFQIDPVKAWLEKLYIMWHSLSKTKRSTNWTLMLRQLQVMLQSFGKISEFYI
jgi:hypothetical protein